MKALFVVMAFLVVAATASADILSDTWIRGASSSAVNDDATAVFVNPAGLGLYEECNTWTSLSMTGEDVQSFTFAGKMGALGFGFRRQYLWEACECDGEFRSGDDAIDTYVLGLGIGDERKWGLGVDYRWIRAQFGDREKTGTWDVGLMVRPTDFLSLGASVRNLSEPRFGTAEDVASKLIDVDESSRMTYVAGLALRPIGDRLTLMADASLERDEDFENAVYTAGVEARLLDGLVLRGSLQSSPEGTDRHQEMSFGLWFTGPHTGVGASYRTMDGLDGDIISYEMISSTERMRSLVTSPDGIAEIEIGGPLEDAPSGWSLLGKPRTSAQRIMRDIRTAAKDPSVGVILLNLKSTDRGFLGSPPALAQEIREEILKARERHGVKVLAFLQYGGDLTEYYIATAADKVVLYPVSGIAGLGNFVNIMRFTDTTGKIGIGWDYFSAGKYKSTFHSIGAGPLTDEQREEVQSIVDDSYEELLDALIEGRGFTRDEALAVCSGGIFTSPEALELGLVDELGHYEDAKAAAVVLAGGDEPDEPEDIETVDVSDWRGKSYDWNYGPKIAIVGAYGGIHTGEGSHDPIRGRRSIGSETLVKMLRRVRKDDSVKAVVLRIDSGGGDAIASDIIWRETVRLAEEKPLIVSMADIAGSGGYYIAMSADRIFVDPLTVTGSIGVAGIKPVFGEFYDKIDATYEIIKRGEHSDMWSTTRHLTEDEGDMVRDVINHFYDDFVKRVSEGRDLPIETTRELAQGRVYTGNQAVENGLADELGGLHDAIDHACEILGTDREAAAVAFYRERGSFVDHIMSEVTMKLGLHGLLDLETSGIGDLLELRMVDDLLD